MIKPKPLQKGDTVAVIAPASPPNQHNLKKGIEYLKEIGLNVVTGAHLYKKTGTWQGLMNSGQRIYMRCLLISK